MITKRDKEAFFKDPVDHQKFKELQKAFYSWAIDILYDNKVVSGALIFDDTMIIDFLAKSNYPERHKIKMAIELMAVLEAFIIHREQGMSKSDMIKLVVTTLYDQKVKP